jgi:peptide/nickel transport system permease protein
VLTLLIYGARVSLLVGLFATVISMLLGTFIGIASGFLGGRTGGLLYRLTEWFLVIPFVPLALVLATLLGGSIYTVGFVIGVTSWPGTALLIRAQTLSIKNRPYMERARVLGAGNGHQMLKHILPNVMPMVLANTTLTVAGAILAETTLSFLGLGDANRISWGTMLDSAFSNGALTLGAWWFLFPPGVCVILVVLSFTLVGQAMEEIFNPRLRDR